MLLTFPLSWLTFFERMTNESSTFILQIKRKKVWTRCLYGYALCPGQDIILYCKFIKETLQYRWCTIQGFITPSGTISTLSGLTDWQAAHALEEGRQTVTITEFLVMVRVLWPSLDLIWTSSKGKICDWCIIHELHGTHSIVLISFDPIFEMYLRMHVK